MTNINRVLLSLTSFFVLMSSGCSSSLNPVQRSHKEDPANFVERREVVENGFIASGGFKKKKSSILSGQGTDKTIIPDNSNVMVGSTEYMGDENEEDQTTYTFSKLKGTSSQNDRGFSRKRLNVSNQSDENQQTFLNLDNSSRSLFVACADKKVQKEIEDAEVSEEEFEKAKTQETHLS